MMLPSPLAMTALGTALIVGAGLIFFFLHVIRIALIVGAIGAVLLFAAGIAFGYERMGEAKIQPQLDAALAKLSKLDAEATQFKSEAIAASDHAVALVKAKNAQIVALNAKLRERINALPPEVANLSVPAPAGVLLNTNIADANDSAFGPGAGDQARAAAAAAATATVRDWVAWGSAVSVQYGRVAAQLTAIQAYVDGLAAASARAAPVQ